jgi:geranylgeranyl pyrophosphate synthase
MWSLTSMLLTKRSLPAGIGCCLINQMGSYIIGGGGKRLRPMTVLLASRALGYEGDDHITLAASDRIYPYGNPAP